MSQPFSLLYCPESLPTPYKVVDATGRVRAEMMRPDDFDVVIEALRIADTIPICSSALASWERFCRHGQGKYSEAFAALEHPESIPIYKAA